MQGIITARLVKRHPQLHGRIRVRFDRRNKRLWYAVRRRGQHTGGDTDRTMASLRFCVPLEDPRFKAAVRHAADSTLAIIRGETTAHSVRQEDESWQ